MPSHNLRFLFDRIYVHHRYIYHLLARLNLRTHEGWSEDITFLFDTGSEFTTIPIALAENLGISFRTDTPMQITGATGTGRGFLSRLSFGLAGLPQWQFQTVACFSPTPLSSPLLCLTDVLANFRFRTLAPAGPHPYGALRLQLKRGHKGRPRS